MKSTELSTALEIRAREIFGPMIQLRKPWQNAKRKDRAAAFLQCWQTSVYLAAEEFRLDERDQLALELGHCIPGPVLEAHVGRDSHP